MPTVPEPALWKTSGFWAAIYVAVMLYAVIRETWGKDEAPRRRILRRVLLAAGALWVLLHGWATVEYFAGISGVQALGPRATPKDEALVTRYAIALSAAAWALLGATVAAAGIFARPSRRGFALPWEGLVLAASLVLAAALAPHRGPVDFRTRFWPVDPLPDWLQRACNLGSLMTLVAGLFTLVRAVQVRKAESAVDPVVKERRRAALAFWGCLLFVGAVLMLERRVMELMEEVAILGPRLGGWGVVHDAFFRIARLPAVLGLLGLLALAFGALHLRRRDGAREGVA